MMRGMIMKKLAIIAGTMAMGLGIVLGATGVAFASPPTHTTPGTPGTPSCVGQTTAYLAEYPHYELNVSGIGNLATFAGATVPQIKQIIDQYCAS